MHSDTCVYMQKDVYPNLHTHVYIRICVHKYNHITCIHTKICTCVCISTYTHVHVYVYIYMYICPYTYSYTYRGCYTRNVSIYLSIYLHIHIQLFIHSFLSINIYVFRLPFLYSYGFVTSEFPASALCLRAARRPEAHLGAWCVPALAVQSQGYIDLHVRDVYIYIHIFIYIYIQLRIHT